MRLSRYEPFYGYHNTNSSKELAERLEVAAGSLAYDLQDIKPLDLNISDYSQRYLQDKLRYLEPELIRDAYIVGSTLCRFTERLEDFTFIEYGGGTGFLSLLAKRVGIGTVVYNDIYDVSCTDARGIARTLGCEADHYVRGGIDELVRFCWEHRITANGIGSYDVLEHIYDVDDFCRKLHLISRLGTIAMHVSGANMFFYPYVKSVSKKQNEVETKGREEEWGHKKRDCLLAYSEARRRIIRDYCPSLGESKIERMVINTRGLTRDDILRCIDRYVERKEFPDLIEHPTNTCDPYTGNWMEHLINPYYLRETLSFNGFDALVLAGCWSITDGSLRNTIVSLLNRLVRRCSTHVRLHVCSCYSIYGRYTGEFSDEIHRQHMYKCRHSLAWYIILPLWELFSHFYHP